MTEQLSETEELNMLKERVAELEEDYKFLSERLRALEKQTYGGGSKVARKSR